jgi:hypothetical protein
MINWHINMYTFTSLKWKIMLVGTANVRARWNMHYALM